MRRGAAVFGTYDLVLDARHLRRGVLDRVVAAGRRPAATAPNIAEPSGRRLRRGGDAESRPVTSA